MTTKQFDNDQPISPMRFYSLSRLILLIFITGIVITVLYSLMNDMTYRGLLYIGHGLIMTGGIWLGCMVIVGYLWKRFPWEHQPFRHLLSEIALITTYTLLFSWILWFAETRFGLQLHIDNFLQEILSTLLITYLITAIHEAVFFYFQWKRNFSKSVKLEKANIEANYQTLKAQVNPHFLFNSLNSLTAMVDDNQGAVEYISNMSAFLRYMLGTRERELVHLNEEMDIVRKYIKLQQSRFDDHLVYRQDIPEKYDLYLVPPLAVQMLVENSIKHNIISSDKPLTVFITVNNDTLIVENNLQKKTAEASTGHGLENIRERFRFFTTQKMEISEREGKFRVEIPLLTLNSA